MKMLISRPNDRSILFYAGLLCKRKIKRSKEASLLKIHGGKNLHVNDTDFFFKQPCSAAREAGGRVPRSPRHPIIARRAARFQPAAAPGPRPPRCRPFAQARHGAGWVLSGFGGAAGVSMEQAASARRQNCVSAALSAVGGAASGGSTYLAMASL